MLLSLQVLDHALHGVDKRLGSGVVELIGRGIRVRNDVIVDRAIGIDKVEAGEVGTICTMSVTQKEYPSGTFRPAAPLHWEH